MKPTKLWLALACAGIGILPGMPGASSAANDAFDPLLDGGPVCGARTSGQPAIIRALVLTKTETAPFQPVPAAPAPSSSREAGVPRRAARSGGVRGLLHRLLHRRA